MTDWLTDGVNVPATRRSPCPCGSGKRYKNCHGRTAGRQTVSQLPSTRSPAFPQQTVEHVGHRLGDALSHREGWPVIVRARSVTDLPPQDDEILSRPLYKFMRHEHAVALLSNGRVRVGTMYEYRDEETHGCVVGDEGEGRAARYDDRPLIRSDAPATQSDVFHQLFEVPVRVQNIVLGLDEESENLFVYSTASVFSRELFEDFGADGYTTCVRIDDPLGFMNALTVALRATTSVHDGSLARCVYRDRVARHNVGPPVHPALIKPTRLRRQAEARMLWHSTLTPIAPLIVVASELSRHVAIHANVNTW